MASIKSLDRIRKTWETVTPQRSEQYAQGVANPLRNWATNTLAAADNWGKGVESAITAKRFERGVSRAGQAKYLAKTAAKGPSRWREGVALSGDDYQKGFAPIHAAIASATLPPRFPKRDPRNLDRVAAIVKAIIAAKQ